MASVVGGAGVGVVKPRELRQLKTSRMVKDLK